ncbi:ESX secretion-associated protein EspG [Prauserella halophila]|uniref:ESX secretion-associated protein EspG n=1 Tax=Prauserella halophila TaxID=185641 RepID=UPI0020A5CDCC|nr:ESX secretion-associated protein EspG [Prauserella halophila]MCP2238048.1 EspG family protein [Prauserella halophila]
MFGSFEFVLGSVEASVVAQAFGVDIRRFPLRVRNTTADPGRLRTLAGIVSGTLAERGLLVGKDPHPNVRRAFELVGSHRVSVAISGIDDQGAEIARVVLTDGADALGVTQHHGEDDLEFRLFSDDDLIDVLTAALPAVPAATGPEATVRQGLPEYRSAFDVRKAAERAHDEEETSAFGNIRVVGKTAGRRSSRGAGESGEERLRRAFSGERRGGGQIVVSASSGEAAVPRSVGWVDTDEGRYLVHAGEVDNEFVARYEPAGRTEVSRAIHGLVAETY